MKRRIGNTCMGSKIFENLKKRMNRKKCGDDDDLIKNYASYRHKVNGNKKMKKVLSSSTPGKVIFDENITESSTPKCSKGRDAKPEKVGDGGSAAGKSGSLDDV